MLRRPMLPVLLTIVSLMGTATTLSANPESGSPLPRRYEVRRTNGLVYATAPVRAPKVGTKELLLDLYEPEESGTTLRPAIIVIHGGGFRGGSRTSGITASLCQDLAARGFVCLCIDYRLQGDDPPTTGKDLMERAVRAAVLDAGASLEWLLQNAEKYRVDTGRIAIGGGSAGAITSLLLTYTVKTRTKEKLPIAAVVNLWGSMYHQTDRIEAGAPPMLTIHGTKDEVVPFVGAEEIARQCQKVGVTCELYAIEGAGHGVPLTHVYQGTPLNERIVRFLHTHLKLK